MAAVISADELGYLQSLAQRGDKVADILTNMFGGGPSGPRNVQVARLVSTSNVAAITGLLTVDSVVTAAGDIVLLAGQSTASQNGLYIVSSGAWTRMVDALQNTIMKPGMLIPISEGTSNAGAIYELQTAAPITVGTTNLSFGQAVSAVTNGSITTAKLAANAVTGPKLDVSIVGEYALVNTSGATGAPGAPHTTRYDITAAGGNITGVMADGTFAGQRKRLVCTTASGGFTVVITVTHMVDAGNGHTITFNAAGQWIEMEWSGVLSKWFFAGGSSYGLIA